MEHVNSFESLSDLRSNNTDPKESHKAKKISIQLESSLDLFKIPIMKLLNVDQKFCYNGAYYKRIIRELIEPPETRNISSIDPVKAIVKPNITSIIFKVEALTNFGDSVLITGSTSFLGNWAVHQKMDFGEGHWNKHLIEKDMLTDSLTDKDKIELSAEYFGTLYTGSDNGIKSPLEDLELEFKFILNQNGNLIWESIENRKLRMKEAIYILENLINTQTSNCEKNLVSFNQGSMNLCYDPKKRSLIILSYFNKC